jgi:uncharacterized protein (TIGR02588 family)
MSKVKKNVLEWSVFAVGLAVVLGTLGFLVWDLARGGSSPPDLTVELGSPRRQTSGWAVPVTVHNRGDETAEGVHVEVVLAMPAGGEERAELEIAFVPRGSHRKGWVTFTRAPAAGRLTGRVSGYEEP